MSKLINKIKLISEGSTVSLGFKASTKPKNSPLVLVGELPQLQAVKVSGKAMDAFLVSVDNMTKEKDGLKKFVTKLDDLPCGIALERVAEEVVPHLQEAGCDFVVFRGSEADAAILQEESLGKVMIADASWTDTNLRLLEQLPVDILLVDVDQQSALTIQSLITLKRFTVLSTKPLLIKVSYIPSEKELLALLSVPVRGLVLPIKDEKDFSEIDKLRNVIDKLPPLPHKKSFRAIPVIPPVANADIDIEEE